MSTWVNAVLIAVAVAGGAYVLLELFEVFRGTRHAPKNPVSGPESLVGSQAKVLSAFEQRRSGQKLTGRVQINGEDGTWCCRDGCRCRHLQTKAVGKITSKKSLPAASLLALALVAPDTDTK